MLHIALFALIEIAADIKGVQRPAIGMEEALLCG